MHNNFFSFFANIKLRCRSEFFSEHDVFFKKLLFAFFLFVVFYVCLFAFFFLKKEIETKFLQTLTVLEKNGIAVSNPKLTLLFPSIQFDSAYHAKFPELKIEKGTIKFSLWNKEINISGKLAKGEVLSAIQLDSLFSPSKIKTEIALKNINLENLKNSFPLQSFLTIKTGTASLTVSSSFQLQNNKPDLSSLKGTIKTNINKISISNYIPIIKNSEISDGSLKLDLQIEGRKLQYCAINFNSNILSAELNGSAELNYQNIAQSVLNLNSFIKIDQKNINPELTPANTRKSILEKNEVRMKITGTPNKPQINIL